MAFVRRKHIGAVVDHVLVKYRIKPPIDVHKLADELGIDIKFEDADDDLSGFIIRGKGLARPVIGVNSLHSPTRQRFTIAHEIGHFLLHKAEQIHVDRITAGLHVKKRDGLSSEGTDVDEREANLFAAELLMPKKYLEKDISSGGFSLLDEEALDQLAEKYLVSTQALTFRLSYLGFIEHV
jgi:Zn-dependent peptidase ImmA (M78 family)